MNTLARIGLWFGSMLLSVAAFSVAFSMVFNAGGALILVFRFTMIFVFPVWCLYLPVVLFFKDAEQQRGRVILLSATLVGPVSVLLWSIGTSFQLLSSLRRSWVNAQRCISL